MTMKFTLTVLYLKKKMNKKSRKKERKKERGDDENLKTLHFSLLTLKNLTHSMMELRCLYDRMVHMVVIKI